jgi:hypothetical protein
MYAIGHQNNVFFKDFPSPSDVHRKVLTENRKEMRTADFFKAC